MVQTESLGSAFVSAMQRLNAACTTTNKPDTPCLSRRRVSLAKKPSTALNREAEVGVKW